MLLALWFDFWNPASWTPGPPPQLPDGGAHGSGHGKQDEDDYAQYPAIPDRANQDYWDEREKFLRRHLPAIKSAAVEDDPKGKKLVRKYERVVKLAHKLPDSDKLREADRVLKNIALQIEKIEAESDDEAVIALLLS